jgi:hypothetical protein
MSSVRVAFAGPIGKEKKKKARRTHSKHHAPLPTPGLIFSMHRGPLEDDDDDDDDGETGGVAACNSASVRVGSMQHASHRTNPSPRTRAISNETDQCIVVVPGRARTDAHGEKNATALV